MASVNSPARLSSLALVLGLLLAGPQGTALAGMPTDASCAGSRPTAGSAESAEAGRTILLVGASYAEPGSPLATAIRFAMGVSSVEAAGVRGAALRRWLPRVLERVQGRDVVVAEFGGNGVPTASEIEDADAAMRRAGARSVRWILPPVGAYRHGTLERREAARQAVRAARGITVIEHRFVASDLDVAGDGQHLTLLGYAHFGAALSPSESVTRRHAS